MNIFKYPIEVGENTLEMPVGSKVLTVQEQHGQGCIWARVIIGNEIEKRTFIVRGTGHEFEINAGAEEHVGTFQLMNGALVWHVFEAVNIKL